MKTISQVLCRLLATWCLAALPAAAAIVAATYPTATTVPVTAATYSATGNTVNFTLNFAPPAGTNLTVVKNTGLALIQGTFDNLAQGQKVNLTYGGVNYPFVANYYGGSGNDLVLQWANNRLLAWGLNDQGQLGNNNSGRSLVPVPVDMTGVLAGKTITTAVAKEHHNLVLCSDGTLAKWGNTGAATSKVPVLVSGLGTLAGKTVVAMAAGYAHGLALCADGTMAAWGANDSGQLGNESTTDSTVPVLVTQTGVLAGKSVVAVSAGVSHNLALCSDGTLAAWGYNFTGQLGNNATTLSSVPVLVDRTGVLSGKSVIGISAGRYHNFAWCSDGTLVAWGDNEYGQLGDGGTTDSLVPVLVDRSGALSGKTLVAMAAGDYHNLALCSDGTLAAWGKNTYGQLGNGSYGDSSVPVPVDRNGALSGKTVIAIAAGWAPSLALCADGAIATWGYNFYGSLGNNSNNNSAVPVTVDTSTLRAGEKFVAGVAGLHHCVGLAAAPPLPRATTLAATDVTDTGASMKGSVNASGTSASVTIEYGLTTSYGVTVTPVPASASGSSNTVVSATVSGLLAGTTYHYRVIATSATGTATGDDMTFTTTTFATLSGLTVSSGPLVPAFSSVNTRYDVVVPSTTASITVTPVLAYGTSSLKVNGVAVMSGTASSPISLVAGANSINIVATAAVGSNSQTYTVTVTRQSLVYSFNSATTVPVTVANFTATGNTATFALNFAPLAGTNLTVVRNTGTNYIQGTFDNLPQGQLVPLVYGGVTYNFVANYFGGTGNDLVLQWANTRLVAWGSNSSSQLGNNSADYSSSPVPVDMSGVLAGKTVITIASGSTHSLALCADGALAAWGSNSYGQLGNNSASTVMVPVLVDRTGVLAGKMIVATAAGNSHSLALCSDGTMAAWGYNDYGQLGNNSTTQSKVPVLVIQTGVLAGKTVIAIAAGDSHSMALCADGTVATWGYNINFQLGNGNTTDSSVPVLVTQTGVLSSKTVVAIAAGGRFNLVLCSDGTLATWGHGTYGELGNKGNTNSSVPVLVDRTGVLAGKTVTLIAAGGGHAFTICSDGTVAGWGNNYNGQLGNGASYTSNLIPVLVNRAGVLAGKTVSALAGGTDHSLALCSDGTLAAWGDNNYRQLGNNSQTDSSVPVLVNTYGIKAGERFVATAGGTSHSLALVATPMPPAATTLAATGVLDTAATLHGSVNAQGTTTAVSFEYGLTTAYGTTVAATPASASGATDTAAAATLGELLSGTVYHYRIVASSGGGTVKGGDMTFTTPNSASLLGMSLGGGTLSPAFSYNLTSYFTTVPYTASSITVTPVVELATSTVKINGVSVASGMPSNPLNLAVGGNPINIVVAAADGINTKTYAVTVIRLPDVLSFSSATDVPVTAHDFLATGNTATITLNYAPVPGTSLTVVNNMGFGPIQGVFANLAQDQRVNLSYSGVFYQFLVNYHGGTGNDLVLQWANSRFLSWGYNSSGQLGNNSTTTAYAPGPVDMTGVLAGKAIASMAAGSSHCLVLCTDGTVAAWGDNANGQLGNGGAAGKVPVTVTRSGVLAGKRVIAVAAGSQHNLALCSDGTLAAWGSSANGQLGNNTMGYSTVPVLVDRTGVLSGRTVVAISTRGDHSVALCADGTLAAWGANESGQLGNNTTTRSAIPVLVDKSGALAGKTISCVSAGGGQTLALCTDGALAVWGGNLGDGTFKTSSTPVWVNQSGVLSGKTLASLDAGAGSTLILCTDGTRAGWGFSSYGLLGSTSVSTSIAIPTLLTPEGALTGKTTAAQAPGGMHILALCTDGTLTSWGFNMYGSLGNNSSTDSYVPVLVNTTGLRPGERFTAVASGSYLSLALVATPPPPLAATMAATGVTDTDATLNGNVNAQANSTVVSFEYGLTTAYGSTIAATPAVLTGSGDTASSVTLGNLPSGMTYHYRVVATNGGGTVRGEDMTFTTTTLASLTSLTLDSGALSPAFSSINTSYVVTVPFTAESVSMTPTVLNPGATVTIAGDPVESGAASGPLDLTVGNNPVDVVVTAADGIITKTYRVTITRLPAVFTFNSATEVPVTASDFTASGNSAVLALNFAPPVGTNLTVVNNTGSRPIQGTFSNLAQGQRVEMTYGGVTYPFIANYGGGTGNDLVLQWANVRMLAWGYNTDGQLGNNSTTNSLLPVPVDLTGVLAGKSVMTVATGPAHGFALCADGTLAAWGRNSTGQLGNNSTTSSSIPVPVDRTGVLAGRTVIAVAAGDQHSLALCSDGTLAAWGYNYYGQIGNNGPSSSYVKTPVLVDRTGVLSGKSVIAVAAAGAHSLALCSDGTLAAWGYNYFGQLGTNSTTNCNVPALVDRTGVLAGKMIIGMATGGGSAATESAHCLVLCSDGTMAAWGSNGWGQLGGNVTTSSSVPRLVDMTGVLAGKTVTAIAAGYYHSVVLCSDGTMAAWGSNSSGQLGNNSTTYSNLPVLVNQSAVLSGKTVTAVTAGYKHGLALCADGTLAAWGENGSGQLGNNSTTDVLVPVLVNTSALATGERFMAVVGGSGHSLTLVASPPPPAATTLAASAVTDTGATLNGSVNAYGTTTSVSFEYGLTTSYGSTAAATPASATGVTATAAGKSLGALLSGTTYHYRVVAGRGTLTVPGADMSFTTSTFGTLSSLALSSGTVSPAFASNLTSYIATVPNAASSITVTPVAAYANSTVKVNNVVVASGTASNPVSLAVGNNVIAVTVAAADGINTKTYNLAVTRLPGAFTFNSAASVPVTVADFVATGNTVAFALNFAPPAGTPLTAVKNTGIRPIQGTFDNLAQGQRVDLTYAGITYPYWANYFGGTGNDLVLQWANTRVLGWGANTDSQLGNGLTTNSSVPVPPDMTGVLVGKVIVAISSGTSHSLALCADGTMAAWGKNDKGQLGNSTYVNSYVPVLVDAGGVLAGRTVVAISAGDTHNLALCADGTVASWGYNWDSQLGNAGSNNSNVPVMVNTSGVLAGRSVAAIAAGGSSNLVLCADGVLAAWGANAVGQLGNNSLTNSSVPVAVDRTGVLAGKTVAAIAMGSGHCLVLCADGALAAWGYNSYGQLGNGSFTNSSVPVSVNTTGVLSGKTTKAIAAGGTSSLVLCVDGALAAWGRNFAGQLGNNSTTDSNVPVSVNTGGVLAGKSVIDVAVGGSHCLAACSDGTMAAWGYNSSGQLGNNGTTNSSVPVWVNASGLAAGERFSKGAPGSAHNFCLVISPPRPVVATVAASGIGDTAATLKGSVNACGNTTAVSFQYGLTSLYGSTIAATPATASGATTIAESAALGSLLSGTTYHYRVVATNAGGTAYGEDMTFTTSAYCTLASLNLSSGTLTPGFTTINAGYSAFVPFAVSNITVTPVTVYATSTVKVNGTTVASGTASAPIALAVGNNPINIVITAQAGTNTMTYTVTVTRLPEVFTFNSAASVPVTVNHFVASGNTAAFALAYAPTTGTSLMVVKNTGTGAIQGTFSNLGQGQIVRMTYGGTAYSFMANYFGGTGNDLVLQWANTRLLAWGANASGQLGNNSTTNSSVPVAVDMGGVLSGKTLISTSAGAAHSLALGVDGSLAAWGSNSNGRLGNNSTTSSTVPVEVDRSGTLSGKTVVSVATGSGHSLALCSDGTLAAWGYNTNGQLGNAGASYSIQSTPSPVIQTGVLAGKTVIAVAAGSNHSLALCADGSVAVWGDNYFAQMGNNTDGNDDSKVPLLVNGFGALAGKQVKAIAAGANFSLALCADGTLVAWGSNSHGQFGNNTTTYSAMPVSVNQTGVLAGKTVTAIAAGGLHCLALCSDGTLAAWGSNYNGQLGNGTSISSSVPLLVTRTGALSGKTVSAIHAGDTHSLALCSDGTLAAWGYNTSGQLGDGTTTSRSAPLLVSTTALRTGERVIGAATGSSATHNFALVAIPPAPVATTLAASGITDTSATLNAAVYPNGTTTTVSFEYGLTTSYGTVGAATPATVSGTGAVAVSFALGGMLPGTTWHYRAIATNELGTGTSDDMTFTTSTFGTLSGLTLSTGTLAPAFSNTTFSYIATVPYAAGSITLTPVATHATSTVKVNSAPVASGTASDLIDLVTGDNPITTVVTSADGINTQTYSVTVNRLPEVFSFNSAADTPTSANGFSIAGITANLALNYPPLPGTGLTVLNNKGNYPIQGAFDNLAQGQIVRLTHAGVTYQFVANYFGGTGNDLVLQWANTRLLAWGANSNGQLGNNTTTNSSVAVPVDMTGVLARKAIIAIATGDSHNLALCSDGTLAATGHNYYGQCGNNSTTNNKVPVLVDQTGVFSGKTVVAIAAAGGHSLALCSDGTLGAWGWNYYGQLGTNSTTDSKVPTLVNTTGVLMGKRVVAVAAGGTHSLALCADGALVAWGSNSYGQLGNGNTTNSSVPVLVNQSGALAGKTVIAVAAGLYHCLALCTDGTMAAWGYNFSGQLGNNSTTNSSVPVWVDRTGALAGKTVTAIRTVSSHCMGLCSDGTVVAWGSNSSGELGNNSTTASSVPVLLNQSGVLAGKSVVGIACGSAHSLTVCSDGRLAAWGFNTSGQLGNNSTTQSSVPVWVNPNDLRIGECFAAAGGGMSHNLALVASPPPPVTATLAATGIRDTGATISGSVNANGSITTVSFEFGLTSSYGSTISATPASVSGTTTTTATTTLAGLLAGSTYHYRMVATSAGGTVTGGDMTFTTTTFASLADLALSDGTLYPSFASINARYVAQVPFATHSITATPVTSYSSATVAVTGVTVESGAASAPISLAVGNNSINIVVTAEDVTNTQTYTVTVTRLPEIYAFDSASTVPVTASHFVATGNAATFGLNHAPQPGANLTVVENTGPDAIQGVFDNLAQGQVVMLTYGGVGYAFTANYFGGTGNDLVLQWANTRLLAWGSNSSGVLGNNSTTSSNVAVQVDTSGVLAGKTVIGIAPGANNSLVLCADGTVAAWGDNSSGQLGNGSNTGSKVPVLVNQSGVLAGKTVVAISAAAYHSLVLCSDGTMAAWGSGNYGRLGNGSASSSSNVPVLVDQTGVLAGKTVIAIAARDSSSYALCADGTVAAWGYNTSYQLGDGTSSNRNVPVWVNQTTALFGRKAVALGAGGAFGLVACADGALSAWGANGNGQLGNNSTSSSSLPVLVDRTGVLAGKTIAGVATGTSHSLALCGDGTLAAWGANGNYQLGDGSTTDRSAPVWVNQTGVLAGQTITAIAGGAYHNMALCADGSLMAWGYNSSGQLGDASNTNRGAPVLVNTSGLVPGVRFVNAVGGYYHTLALAAYPLQSATPLPATLITGMSSTLNGSVNANDNTVTVAFEYGLDETYGSSVSGAPAAASGKSDTALSAPISGLTPGTIYHYRVVATSDGGIVRSADATFTTLSDNAKLAALSLSDGMLAPVFDKLTESYVATVPFAIDGVTVTPTRDHFGASVQVGGVPVASGTASGVISLPVGSTTITTVVTAEDGIATKSYTITLTRLPQEFVFNSATDVPVTANGFSAGGYPVNVILGYSPVPGTFLTMVNNTGLGFIHGTFGNLAQGQRVTLNFGGTNYAFVANYFGGTGNDLVLQWADTKVTAWGSNSYGQLGDASTTRRLLPTYIDDTGVLAGKTILTVAGGYLHSLALCSDGTLAAWGYNVYGQLGNNSSVPSSVPVAVDQSGVLAGKTVIAISAGPFHNLALCADGSVAAWGYNNYGQLGTGDKVTSRVPVLVSPVAVLAGKQVVAVAAAAYSSFALCADGSLAAWGYNDEGELGDGTTANSTVPVAVDTSGVLAGKQIASLSAGQYHTLALCTDGTLVAWGYNNRGQLGNNSTASSKVPVTVGSSGDLSGKTVVATRASGAHSLALCADGTLAAWGWNHKGQLGVTGMTQSPCPLAVDTSGVTASTSIAQIAVGGNHGLVLCTNGTMAAWGDNAYGQLGNNSLTTSSAPSTVDTSSLEAGARVMLAASGSATMHNLAVVALPSASSTPLATTLQGAALGDSDHDGIANLIEYAFGLAGANSTGRLPQPQRAGDSLELRFTQPAGVTGISYGAEWSATLQPGSWKDIPDTGSGNEHVFRMPAATAPNLFLRLKVTGW